MFLLPETCDAYDTTIMKLKEPKQDLRSTDYQIYWKVKILLYRVKKRTQLITLSSGWQNQVIKELEYIWAKY